MSRIQETKRAYDKLLELLNQEIRKRSGSTQELERFAKLLMSRSISWAGGNLNT
jgi:hypothetical protein